MSADSNGAGWFPPATDDATNSHMSRAFADAYEQAASRITAPVSVAALQRAGPIERETRLLDIGAGAGALSIPAAHAGAIVTAIDIAPGMVELLHDRLLPFPNAIAQVMDGQAMDVADASFDAAISVFGVSLFADWRRALSEQVRVLRPGGKAVLATWRTPPGGGPFVILAEALATTFPDRLAPAPPPGFLALAEPEALASAFTEAGLVDVKVEEVEAVWEGPAGVTYLDELRDFHAFVAPYALLDEDAKTRLDRAILAAVERRATGDRIVLTTTVTLATGTRADGTDS